MTSRKKVRKSLNLKVDLIPESNSNRPGNRITPRFITIDNTDNTKRGADARAHALYFKSSHAQKRQVSWHYTVDDKRCIKHLPTNEEGWHTGSSQGNSQSIGIEICMNEGIDQKNANHQAATLVAVLMCDLQIPLSQVVPHQHWSGKNCSSVFLNRWDNFKNEIGSIYDNIKPFSEDIVHLFAEESVFAGHGKGDETVEHSPFCSLPYIPERQLQTDIDPEREFLIRMNDSKWVNGTILHYHFLDNPSHWRGATEQKEAVRQAFKTWKEVGIGLKFEEVSDPRDAEIRISFDYSRGSSSYVGRDALNKPPEEDTMNFGWDLTTSHGRNTALHEIGHALGFKHEHQSALAGIVWNERNVLEFYESNHNWPESKTRHNILNKISAELVEGSDWDRDSIMHYEFAAGLIISPPGYETQPLIPQDGLSPADIEEVRRLYPAISEVDGALQSEAYIQLEPYLSVLVDIIPGEQLNFVIRPPETRTYTIETIGSLDTVIVLFEDINGVPDYVDGDDDSGFDKNAQIVSRLIRGRIYYLRLRLYYANGKGAVILR